MYKIILTLYIAVVSFNINSMNLDEQLFEAVYKCHLKKAQELIKKGANINTKNKCGLHLINYAAEFSTKPEIMIKLLLSNGANINTHDDNGDTPLIKASFTNRKKKIIKLLLDTDADVNAKNIYGQTPIWWAAFQQNKKTIELLLDAGADRNIKDNNDKAPIEITGSEHIKETLNNYMLIVKR